MTMSEEWKRQRSTSLQILRGLGYGKYNTEGKIQEEAAYLMDIFKNLNGKPFDPAPTLMISVSNVICSLLYGRRYEHSDDEYQYLLKTVRELIHLFFEETEGDFVWLYQLKPSYRKVIKDFDACCKKLIAFNQKKIDERRVRIESEDFDEPSDFIEGYLKELQPNSKGERKMAEDWLIAILNDFFLAGAETTSTTLTWAILLMASFPDVQKKVCTVHPKKHARGSRLNVFCCNCSRYYPYPSRLLHWQGVFVYYLFVYPYLSGLFCWHDRPGASEGALKNMDKHIRWIH